MGYQIHTFDTENGLLWHGETNHHDIRIAIETMYRVHYHTDKETIIVNDRGRTVCSVGRPTKSLPLANLVATADGGWTAHREGVQ